ncbi:MAG TPA: hypothetical protein VN679_03865 [Candidatus Acidoferrales bacterium]|jgi:hypothetical protein|nr:hypothetical protein [Candidatus Acidoferrales bacterium]
MFLRSLCSAVILAVLSSAAIAQSLKCKSEVPVGIVNGSGESFHGLSSADFLGRAGKASISVKNMTFDDGPRRIVLVVDTSKKLNGDTRQAERTMIQTLLGSARSQDSFAMVTARGPEHVVKFGEEHSAFIEALPTEGESRHGKEQSVLDGVMKAIEFFGDAKPGDSIIVMAADLAGSHTANSKMVARALDQHHIRMFGLALGLVQVKNSTVSGQSTTAWGLATATPGVGDFVYDTGDADFYPLTRNSGGMVMAVMNYDSRATYSMKDPKFVTRAKQQTLAIYNMIASYYKVELEGDQVGEWSFEPTPDVRKAAPNMFLLYPHEISSCATDAKVASSK